MKQLCVYISFNKTPSSVHPSLSSNLVSLIFRDLPEGSSWLSVSFPIAAEDMPDITMAHRRRLEF